MSVAAGRCRLTYWLNRMRLSSDKRLACGCRLALGLVLANDILAADRAAAQEALRVTPSLTTSEVYDSNLFSLPSHRTADLITRVTPGIDSEYRSTLLTAFGRYSVDAERFANHVELTRADARQHGAVGVEYRPTRRLTLAADGELSTTQNPGELNAETGLTYTRATARRITAHSAVTRQFRRITTGTVDYSFTDDRLAGLEIRAHTARIGTEHHVSSRNTVTLDYRLQQFVFDDTAATLSTTAHSLNVGWARAITRRASFSLAAGPRVTNGAPAPEASASIAYQLRSADLSLAYARTNTTIIGLAGTAAIESVTADATWSAGRSLHGRVSPGYFQSTHAQLRARVYRMTAEIDRRIAKDLSLGVALEDSIQRGSLYPALAGDTIPRRAVVIKLVAAAPPRSRETHER